MRKKVLVADDDKSILWAAEMLLKGKGYDVTTVDDGKKAILSIKNEKPDFAILDVMMPEKNGFEICKEIKENDETKDIIVIVFSGNIDGVEKGFDYGADDCLVKPLDWDKLVERMETLGKK